jgi:hypothetical protein
VVSLYDEVALNERFVLLKRRPVYREYSRVNVEHMVFSIAHEKQFLRQVRKSASVPESNATPRQPQRRAASTGRQQALGDQDMVGPATALRS